MKRLVYVIVFFLLIVGGVTAQADHYTRFIPEGTNFVGGTIDEWFGASDTRALFTIMLALDYCEENSKFDLSFVADGISYVILDREGEVLEVIYLYDGNTYLIVYSPEFGVAVACERNGDSVLTIEAAYDEMGYEYHRNSSEMLYKMAETMMEWGGL